MVILLQDSKKYGCGDSDGTFNSVRLFTCDSNNAVFVNISNVKLIPPLRPERKVRQSHHTSSSQSNQTDSRATSTGLVNGSTAGILGNRTGKPAMPVSSDISSIEEGDDDIVDDSVELYPVTEPQVGDRVIWMGEHGYERATIKWMGILPDDDNTQNEETLIGVEFVSYY